MDLGSVMKAQLVFSGDEDPYGWILKAEKCFMLNGCNDEEKVAYASLLMEGKALNWLLLMETNKPIQCWEMFKHELKERFATTRDVSSAYEQLLSLRQYKTSSVAHYRERFESMVAPIVSGISDDKLIRAFINGLNDDVKAKVESTKSENLVGVMSLAQEIEDEIRRTTKEKDLVMEEPSLISTTAKKPILRFRGKIGSREVNVKIDPLGVSRNLISKELVTELQIPVEKNTSRGNRSEECKRVVLEIDGIELVESFYPVKLPASLEVDVILGVEWLRRRGLSCKFSFPTNPKAISFCEWYNSK